MTWSAWLPLALVCLLGAMSPGPSLAVVARHAFRGGVGDGIVCAMAHGVGILLWALLMANGLGVLLTEQAHLVLCRPARWRWVFALPRYSGPDESVERRSPRGGIAWLLA